MDSSQYRTRARALLHEAHELHQRVAATMTALGDDAHTGEWQTLYAVLNAVGVACDIMGGSLDPRPSVFDIGRAPTASDAPAARGPMVCTECLEPVMRASWGWAHATADAAEACPQDQPEAIPGFVVTPTGDLEQPKRWEH